MVDQLKTGAVKARGRGSGGKGAGWGRCWAAADGGAMLGAPGGADTQASPRPPRLQALVLDTPLMNYISATDCEVAVVGTPFNTVRGPRRSLGSQRSASQRACRLRAPPPACRQLPCWQLPCRQHAWLARRPGERHAMLCTVTVLWPTAAAAPAPSASPPQYSVATAFPANFSNDALVQRYNQALVALEDVGCAPLGALRGGGMLQRAASAAARARPVLGSTRAVPCWLPSPPPAARTSSCSIRT